MAMVSDETKDIPVMDAYIALSSVIDSQDTCHVGHANLAKSVLATSYIAANTAPSSSTQLARAELLPLVHISPRYP